LQRAPARLSAKKLRLARKQRGAVVRGAALTKCSGASSAALLELRARLYSYSSQHPSRVTRHWTRRDAQLTASRRAADRVATRHWTRRDAV